MPPHRLLLGSSNPSLRYSYMTVSSVLTTRSRRAERGRLQKGDGVVPQILRAAWWHVLSSHAHFARRITVYRKTLIVGAYSLA